MGQVRFGRQYFVSGTLNGLMTRAVVCDNEIMVEKRLPENRDQRADRRRLAKPAKSRRLAEGVRGCAGRWWREDEGWSQLRSRAPLPVGIARLGRKKISLDGGETR